MAKSQFLAAVSLEESEPARVVVDSERIAHSAWLRSWERPGVRKAIRWLSAAALVAVVVVAGRLGQPYELLLSPVMVLLIAAGVWQIRRDYVFPAKVAVWVLTHSAWFFAVLLVAMIGLVAAASLARAPSRSFAIVGGVLTLAALVCAKGVLSDAAGGRQIRLRAAWLLHLVILVILGLLTVLIVSTAVDASDARNRSGVMATVGAAVISALLLSFRSWSARNRKVRTRALESIEELLMVFDTAGSSPEEHRNFCRATLALDRALGSGVDFGARWMRTPLETPSYRVVLLRFACAHSGHGALHDVNRPAGLRAVGYCEILPVSCNASDALKVELRRLANWLRRDVDVAL